MLTEGNGGRTAKESEEWTNDRRERRQMQSYFLLWVPWVPDGQWDSQWLLLDLLLILQEWLASEGQKLETQLRKRNSKWIKAKGWKYFNKTRASVNMTAGVFQSLLAMTKQATVINNFFSLPHPPTSNRFWLLKDCLIIKCDMTCHRLQNTKLLTEK